MANASMVVIYFCGIKVERFEKPRHGWTNLVIYKEKKKLQTKN
jgi:hypothetical protein